MTKVPSTPSSGGAAERKPTSMIAQMTEAFDDLRQPQEQAVDADQRAAEQASQTPHANVARYAQQREVRVAAQRFALGRERPFEPALLSSRASRPRPGAPS